MNQSNVIEVETPAEQAKKVIHLPLGLLGFEHIKSYLLTSGDDDAPFHWLEAPEDPGLAFLLLSPFHVMPDYEMDLSDEDVAFLGLNAPSDAMVFNVVTLHSEGRATINLRGPIVLNGRTMVGKQIVPANAADYSLQHPLPTAD